MTTQPFEISPENLITLIEDGQIEIQYDPVWSMYDRSAIKGQVIYTIRRCIEINTALAESGRPGFARLSPNLVVNDDDTIRHNFRPLGIYYQLLNIELSLALVGQQITFKMFNVLPDARPGRMLEYVDVEVPNWRDPFEWEITIPSKRVQFANYFSPVLNPDIPDQYASHNSINGWIGLKNVTKHYANNNNVGYGQMGNMSIAIYSNGDEIFVTDGYLTDFSDGEADKLLQYFEDRGIINQGQISLGVWRYEVTDYQQASTDMANDPETYEHQDLVDFPINGSVLKAKHYYHTYATEPDFGELCYARIQVLK